MKTTPANLLLLDVVADVVKWVVSVRIIIVVVCIVEVLVIAVVNSVVELLVISDVEWLFKKKWSLWMTE